MKEHRVSDLKTTAVVDDLIQILSVWLDAPVVALVVGLEGGSLGLVAPEAQLPGVAEQLAQWAQNRRIGP